MLYLLLDSAEPNIHGLYEPPDRGLVSGLKLSPRPGRGCGRPIQGVGLDAHLLCGKLCDEKGVKIKISRAFFIYLLLDRAIHGVLLLRGCILEIVRRIISRLGKLLQC